MRGSMGPRCVALMPVELRAVAVLPARPCSVWVCDHSSPLCVPGVWDGASGVVCCFAILKTSSFAAG